MFADGVCELSVVKRRQGVLRSARRVGEGGQEVASLLSEQWLGRVGWTPADVKSDTWVLRPSQRRRRRRG